MSSKKIQFHFFTISKIKFLNLLFGISFLDNSIYILFQLGKKYKTKLSVYVDKKGI